MTPKGRYFTAHLTYETTFFIRQQDNLSVLVAQKFPIGKYGYADLRFTEKKTSSSKPYTVISVSSYSLEDLPMIVAELEQLIDWQSDVQVVVGL